MRNLAISLAVSLLLLAPASIFPAALAQGSKADYARSAELPQKVRGKLRNAAIRPQWLSDSSFWYLSSPRAGERRYWLVDAAGGTKSPLFDHDALARELSRLTSRELKAERLPIERIEPDEGGLVLMLTGDPKLWRLDRTTGAVTEKPASDATPFHLSPLAEPARSTNGGRDTSITFVNNTNESVKMFWVDTEGNRHPYDRLAPGGTASQHTFAGHVWVAVGHDGRELAWFRAEPRPSIGVVNNPAPRPPEFEDPNPDGASDELNEWALHGPALATASDEPAIDQRENDPALAAPPFEPFIKDFNVWGRDAAGQEFPLSSDGSPNDPYDARFYWSPDASRLIAMRTTKGGDRKVTYIESTPNDQLQPRVKTYEYLKPGDDIPLSRPRLFDAASRTQIPVDESLFSNPWSTDNFRWEPDSSRFTFLYNQRGHTVMRVISIDAGGKVTPLVNEECKTFFDYAAKTFLYFTHDSRLIWMSERTGWNHLELRDRNGTLLNQITKGEWVVRSVERVDEDKQQITFKAMGIRPGQDPYHVHLARVNFDGSGLTLLTEGDGTHDVVPSPTGEYLIDTYSRADLPPVTELRRASDGTLIVELERADWSALLETGWKAPERFVAKGRDGTTDIYGLIHRPTNFDPAKKYPVVEAIYAGPHDQHVPKGFRAYSQCNEIAELGFIVVQIDGMGTNWRSKAFHDVAWKNLKDAGYPDRIAWMKSAAAAHPEMDLDNHGRGVGIYGGSAGGQNAMAALLWHGNFYKAAAADCGCHDNRMDKIWWNELWMSWPIGPWYEANSNATNASRLPDDCKLLLTVGEMDENVDPASTMQVVSKLIKAGKDFDLIVFPGEGHGACESPYGRRKRQDFFVRHLMGREPRWE